MKMNFNSYGVIGIKAIDSNWNAGMDKYPKQLGDGTIIGSDKALKYAFRNYWHLSGVEKVMYRKSFHKTESSKKEVLLQPREINERYELLFGESAEKSTPDAIINNLLTAIDCKQFGFLFAGAKQVNQTGVVQIGMGRNLKEDSDIIINDINSPFKNQNEKSKDVLQSSLGTYITVDEAHYAYPFSVNPDQISVKDTDYIKDDMEYSEDDYRKFLLAATVCATSLNTTSKKGCQNEFLIIVNTKPESNTFLNNLVEYITLEDGILNVTKMMDYLSELNENIEEVIIAIDTNSITEVVGFEGARSLTEYSYSLLK